jgi:hypothetical protein
MDMSKIDLKIDRLDEKVDRIDVSLARLEEGVRNTHLLLEKHDAKATTALLKAQDVERDLTEVKAFWTVPLKWAKVIGIIAGAASALFGVWKLLN